MSLLTPCDFKKYDYLFENREQMRATLGLSVRTFNQWVRKDVASVFHKGLLDSLIISHVTKETQRKQMKRSKNITEAQRLQRIDGGKTTRAETKAKLSELILDGYSIEDIAGHYNMKFPSASAKIYKIFDTRDVDKIKETLEKGKV